MDIKSRSGYPASALSNFAPHHFEIDGIKCNSMEGFLQSLKFDKPHIQIEVCKLVGKEAKFRGKKRNKAWKRVQKLWWQGKEYERRSREYQQLLDRAYEAITQNPGFRKALLATGNAVITHSIGNSNPSDTVLTEAEFCSRLMNIKRKLNNKNKARDENDKILKRK
jgi:predicted NAD-dependent protein-ADP-ribosyltransferase YbiA (DUF1768 family)